MEAGDKLLACKNYESGAEYKRSAYYFAVLKIKA